MVTEILEEHFVWVAVLVKGNPFCDEVRSLISWDVAVANAPYKWGLQVRECRVQKSQQVSRLPSPLSRNCQRIHITLLLLLLLHTGPGLVAYGFPQAKHHTIDWLSEPKHSSKASGNCAMQEATGMVQ